MSELEFDDSRAWAPSAMVTKASWIPGGWQWSASGANGMTMGGASSEEEAWNKARAARDALSVPMVPRGEG